MAKVILIATTSAAQSESFALGEGESAKIEAVGLAAGEYADLQSSVDSGSTWNDVYEPSSGSKLRLGNPGNAFIVDGPGLYRMDKETTAGEASIHKSQQDI